MILPLILCLAASWSNAGELQGISHFAAEKTRGTFLVRGVGARPIGMAGAFAGVADDASALTVNPGGIGQLDSLNAVAMYGVLGNGQGLSYGAVAAPVEFGVAGVSVIVLDHGEYDMRDDFGRRTGTGGAVDAGIVAGAAFPNPSLLGRRGYSGVSLEVVREEAGGSMAGLSAGTVVPMGSRGRLGAAVLHAGMPKDGFSLPAVVKAGGSYLLREGLLISADLAYPLVERQPWMAAGVEYSPFRIVTVRAGYRLETVSQEIGGLTGVAVGAGFRAGAFGLDYAYQPFGDLASTHRVSLGWGRGPGSSDGSRLDPKSAAEAEYREAVRLYNGGDYDGAWARSYKALRLDPGHWRSWAMIGNCQYAKGDVAGAVASYERSLAINPSNQSLKSWVRRLKTGD